LCACFFALGALASTPPVARYIAPFTEAGHLSGSILIAEGDEIVFAAAFGYSDYDARSPNTLDTTFSIASVTKPVTQIILMRLLDDGLLAGDDPLSKYLPDFPRGDDITIKQLWQHRSGIPHVVTDGADTTRRYTAAEVADLAAKVELLFEPGAKEAYSSGGYSVLARVLEIAASKSYAQLVAEYVTGPAGMRGTRDATTGVPDTVAQQYLLGTDGWRSVPEEDLSYLVGAGSIYASGPDLLALTRAFVSGELGEKIRDAHLANGNLDWNGSTGGYHTFVQYDRATDRTVIFAGNLQSGAVEWLRSNLMDVAARKAVEQPTLPNFVATDEFNVDGLPGRYELRPGAELPLRVDDEGIWMDAWLLIPTESGDLFSLQDYGVITPVRDENGAVKRLDWKRGDEVWPMKRVGD
jgi:CubicO group peptidase (beta-lactamase class C family)